MTDNEQVTQEIAVEDTKELRSAEIEAPGNSVDETAVNETQALSSSPGAAESKQQAENFKTLREEKKKIERERDEMMRLISEIRAQGVKKADVAEEPQLAPDDLIDRRHLDKKVKHLEDQLNSYKQEANLSVTETRLKQKYPDFDSVVSSDNVETLRLTYPEIADSINSSNNLYNKGISAYTLIKKLGIYRDLAAFNTNKSKAVENSAKPRPLSSIGAQEGGSPIGNANAFANGLTDELKKQLYREMKEAAERA